MAKNTKSVAETVRELAEPIAEEIGCWIWDVEYVKEGARRVLRITIDSEEGITIDDCEKMHRAIDPVLDEADPIEEAYYLEVSSPGVERELRTAEHLYACEGWNVEVKLYAPLNGSKLYRGVLLEVGENGEIRIETKDGETTNVMSFAPDTVAKVNTYFEF
ncbi:MAG: ribosome maturation factor RimP [Ruminococcaceae bacterium]|nr:ribosome maturation factor RimP [Oscillospiraceae bacterium]